MRSKFTEIMDLSTQDVRVTIHLSDVDCNEQFSDRILSLSYPDFSVTIGRGSQSDENIEPAPDNAWFSSRVMSRQHALIRADPHDQILTIQDDTSMHGTFLNGDRVGKERVDLISGDILTFGTEVVRGDDTYQPLKVSIYYDWEEEDQDREKEKAADTTKDTSASTTTSFRNKFTVDFSEEDFDSDYDDDIQIVSESTREQSVEFLSQVDASKTQPCLPTNSTVRPIPVSALVTAASVPDETAADKVNLRNEHVKVPYAMDEEDDSDAEHSPNSPYYSDDEDESEVDSDIFNDESDFADEVRKEDGRDAEIAKASSVPQSAQTSTSRLTSATSVPTVPLDNIEREPSPSDAALARPRLAASIVPPAPKSVSGIPVPPSASSHASALDSYSAPFDKYGYSSFGPQENATSRPSHSFVNPYSYNSLGQSVYSVGALNSYYPSPSNYSWDLWKSVPLSYATAQPPRPTTRFGPPTCGASTSTFPNPTAAGTIDQPSRSTTSSLSSDNSRGKKRKADEVSGFSDDEAVNSTPETTPSKSIPYEQSSPAPLPLSKVTQGLQASTDADEMSGVERESSLEVEEALEQADVFMKELQARVDQAQNEAKKERQVSQNGQHNKADNHVEKLSESDDQAEHNEGRLRKKRKIDPQATVARQSRVAATLKYTATALAGATVGVLGTVIGLASLPTDYFV